MLAGFLCAGARPALCKGEAERDLVQYANTLQGTNSEFRMTHGNTFPATTLPFGMHTWTPQTGVNGDGWKYQFEKDSIRAFQQAHQCSSWTRDYMVYSLMPVCGELRVDQYGRAAKFSHDNEPSSVMTMRLPGRTTTAWLLKTGSRPRCLRWKEVHT